VYGEKGVMISSPINDKLSHGELRWNVGQGWQRFHAEQSTHVTLLEAFTSCIQTDGEPPVTGMDGMINMRIIEGLYESSRMGCFVKLAQRRETSRAQEAE
jgi:predicted dehydrogenase